MARATLEQELNELKQSLDTFRQERQEVDEKLFNHLTDVLQRVAKVEGSISTFFKFLPFILGLIVVIAKLI
jgi:hypothetical protein